MKTTPLEQIFPERLAKIVLGIPVDPILNFLKEQAQSFHKMYTLVYSFRAIAI